MEFYKRNLVNYFTIIFILFLISCRKDFKDTSSGISEFKVMPFSADLINKNILLLNDNNFLLHGYDQIKFENIIFKCTPEGKLIWQKKLPNYLLSNTILLADKNEGFIAIGSITNSSPSSLYFERYNSNGDKIWTKSNSLIPYFGGGVVINSVIDESGNFDVIVNTDSMYLFKYDKNGNLLLKRGIIEQFYHLFSGVDFQGVEIIRNEVTGELYIYTDKYISQTIGYSRSNLLKVSSLGELIWQREDTINADHANVTTQTDKLYISSNGIIGARLNENKIGIYYLKQEYAVYSTSYVRKIGELYYEEWDSAGNYLQNTKIELNNSKNGFLSLTQTGKKDVLISGTINESINEAVSPARMNIIKLDNKNNLIWQKVIETVSPSWAVKTVELNNQLYVSGMQQVADSVSSIFLMKIEDK